MRRWLLLALSHAALAFAVAACTYAVTDPRRWASETQDALLSELAAIYCAPAPVRLEYFIGASAALARVAVRGGMGALAVAEVGKCSVLP